jgi:hypothetical protein
VRRVVPLLLVLSAALLATALLRHISYPLLWHDEAETAMFARRVLDYGYPKVRGPKNAVYSLWHGRGVGVHEASGAWTGTPWAQYYFGALGVLWGDRADDLYARTARMRLPFALAGLGGLCVWILAVLPALGRQRALFATLLLLLFSVSTGLLLHLREARYYALVVLLVGGILYVFLRRQVFGTSGFTTYTALLAGLLFLLFNTFYPAFTALLAGLGLALALRARERRRPVRWCAREALPLVLALAVAAPLLLFFDFLEAAQGWLARFATPGLYLDNLVFLVRHLLRFEWLAPALVLRAAVWLLRPEHPEPPLRFRLEIARLLLLLTLVYALLVAQTPFLFERYFVVLSPALTTMLLLDAFSAVTLLRTREGARRSLGAACAVLAALLAAGSLVVRMPELRGRLQELREPYRGPLDFVIPYLKERTPRPEELVIATNYEGPAFMFYLGSRVTVGFYGADLENDLRILPDVIVPRPWPDQVEVLKALSERAEFRAREFPVENLPWNNNPSLAPSGTARFAHRFRTPPAAGRLPLVILERVPGAQGPR